MVNVKKAGLEREVGIMKFDAKLMTGLLIGILLGLQYHEGLVVYMPLFVMAGFVLLLNQFSRRF